MPNIRGGKGYKKYKKTGEDDNVFLTVEKDQFVGSITKLLGNLNTNVYCQDNKTRICKIAEGIKKKTKFNVGDIVLISLRDCLLSKADLEQGKHSDRGDIIGKFNPKQYDDLRAKGVNPHLFRQTDVLNSMSEKFEKGDVRGAEAIAQSSNNDDIFEYDSESKDQEENTHVTKPKVEWKTQRALGIEKEAPVSANELSEPVKKEQEQEEKDVELDDL
jgi:initiation factor 1A